MKNLNLNVDNLSIVFLQECTIDSIPLLDATNDVTKKILRVVAETS